MKMKKKKKKKTRKTEHRSSLVLLSANDEPNVITEKLPPSSSSVLTLMFRFSFVLFVYSISVTRSTSCCVLFVTEFYWVFFSFSFLLAASLRFG